MKTVGLLAFSCVASLTLLPEPCHAHGGQYRGPGDIVPPGGSRGGSRPTGPETGGPTGPGQPTAPGGVGMPAPTTGGKGPAGPGGRGPAQTGPRFIELVDDLTQWEFWWEFNKDPYLRLKDSVHQGGPLTGSEDIWLGTGLRHSVQESAWKPTRSQILDEVLPALKKAIDSTENPDIASSCMVAMAKVGEDHPDFRLVSVFEPRLRRADQEVRETAALAIGIAGIAGEREVTLLSALAMDTAAGKKACDRAEVDERTRAFATYGLGLLAHRTTNVALQQQVLTTLRTLLADERVGRQDLKIAAIHALSLLGLDRSLPGAAALQDDALACLEQFYLQPLGAGDQLMQSHCPTAIAKLLGPDEPRAEHFRKLFADDLRGKGKTKRSSDDISRSCAIALGRLCRPNYTGDPAQSPDAEHSKLLLATYHGHKDAQTRSFALLALGQIGGAHNRDTLLLELGKGKKVLEKPWCALALGIYEFRAQEAQRARGVSPDPDALIGQTLADEFTVSKQPGLQSALAIGLGLCRWTGAGDQLRDAMLANTAQESLAGYLCIGLALMNDRRSVEPIHTIVKTSMRKPELLKQAAIALGKLGDKAAADELQKLMLESDGNLARLAAIATGLSFIGDRRSIAPLQGMLFDASLGNLPRAFAAVALGGIADKEPLPWNSKFAVDTNYRASVGTLTNGQTGILDIL